MNQNYGGINCYPSNFETNVNALHITCLVSFACTQPATAEVVESTEISSFLPENTYQYFSSPLQLLVMPARLVKRTSLHTYSEAPESHLVP